MFRRFLIAILIFLIAVVIAADRVGAVVASHVLASKLQTDEHLPSRPSTNIGGIPFLTQAFGGKYSDVSVTAHAVPVNNVTVTTLTAHLHGVHVPVSKVLGGSVTEVPVDRVDGTAFVSFTDANSYLAHHSAAGQLIQLSPGHNGDANVTDTLRIGGKKVQLRGSGHASVTGNVITLSVTQLTGASKRLATRVLRQLQVRVPLQNLQFRMQLHEVTATASGLSATGDAQHVVLGGPSGT
jgi:hypothetical protein